MYFLCAYWLVKFAGDCGKMYSPVLFLTVNFAGLRREDTITSRGGGGGGSGKGSTACNFFVMKRRGEEPPSVLQILTQ